MKGDFARSGLWPPLMIAALVVVFLLSPFIVVIGASFDPADHYHVAFPPRGLTLASYASIPAKYLHAALISVMVATIVACLATIIGGIASFGIVRSHHGGKQAFQAFFRLPLQIPFVVTGAVFLQFCYQMVEMTGINPLNGIGGVVIAHTFIAIPYTVASITSVLFRFDIRLEEAAQSLGASAWSIFWQVLLPNIRSGVVAGMFYAFIVSFDDIPIALFLTSGDNVTLPVQMFQDAQFDFRPSMLATSALISVVSLLAIFLVQKLLRFSLVVPVEQR